MRNRLLYRRRIDYRNSPEDRRDLFLYLQAGKLKKKSGLDILDPAAAGRRIVLYCLAGTVLLTGLFFVFF